MIHINFFEKCTFTPQCERSAVSSKILKGLTLFHKKTINEVIESPYFEKWTTVEGETRLNAPL